MMKNVPEHTPLHVKVIIIGFIMIPVFYLLSMSNGVDPFACPPGTKTVTSATSIEKWCVEE